MSNIIEERNKKIKKLVRERKKDELALSVVSLNEELDKAEDRCTAAYKEANEASMKASRARTVTWFFVVTTIILGILLVLPL
jgi:hypothetical protein